MPIGDSNTTLEVIKTLGGLAGLAALIWRALDERRSFLRFSINANTASDGWVFFSTSVDNKGFQAKKIDNAVLLVGPAEEDPVKTINYLLEKDMSAQRATATDDIAGMKKRIDDKGRIIIPIPFYFEENVNIADETLTYALAIPTSLLELGTVYEARFFLSDKKRLHRSTQCSFVCPDRRGS